MPILIFIGSIMGLLGLIAYTKYKLHECYRTNIERELINNNNNNNSNNNSINDDVLPKYEDIIKTDEDILPDY